MSRADKGEPVWHLAATATITAPALEFSRASTYDASLQVRSDSDTLWGSTLQLS
jgi:hypothetical protein